MTLFDKFQALQFTWRDAVDVIVVSFVIYNVLVLIKGTRAMQMAIGLMIVSATYFVAHALDLIALETLSREVLFYLPFAIIVLFQHEIRRALTTVGRKPWVRLFGHRTDVELEDLVRASVELARERVGALIAIEGSESLRTFAESGKKLDAVVSEALVRNIFTPGTPLHDGAVIINGNRIVAAGAFLPLSSNPQLPPSHGTRHRAALGLSEETDALVIVISEENGTIAVAVEGTLHENLSAVSLRGILNERFHPEGEQNAA
ncbi:MAG: diadenylate cyclase CdaA [Thermoanaerobaculia bacterium]